MSVSSRQNAIRRRKDSSETFLASSERRSSITFRKTSIRGEVEVTYKRSRSNPALSDSKPMISRLERRRSAVTFPSTYRSLHSTPLNPNRAKSQSSSISSVTPTDLCCYGQRRGLLRHKGGDWSTLVNYITHKHEHGKQLSLNEIRIRKSLEKAIQKAGYNMNELVTSSSSHFSPTPHRKPPQNLTEVDWSESALPDDHIWAPTNASGDLCYVGEQNCQKSGPRKKCNACHIVVHDNCFPQLIKIGFRCKVTFRESTTKSMRENLVVHHHWVHRRKQDGKCRQCGKSFEKLFGFREPTKIIAISCSWCKEAYHNKVSCFQMHKINEPCTLGGFAKSIVPPTWIIKSSQKQKSLRNRSKKKKPASGAWRKKSARDNRPKTFIVRPLTQQAAFASPTLVFINPKSGGKQGAKMLQSFQWLMNPRQICDLSKGGPQEALELYRKVPNLRILACGGDGTVGWILSVLDKLNLSRPPPVAILPLGTGNDLSRTLNFGPGYTDEPIHKIIQGVEESRMVKLDRWKLRVEKNEDRIKQADEDEVQLSGEYPQSDGVDRPPLDVVNNYFGIGFDAQITLNFHESREAHPAKFTSRIGNKMFYARASVFEYLTRQSKDLSKHVTVVCDGQNITPKIRELKPVCILFLNIPRYSAGALPWGNPTGNEFQVQRHDDELIEVLTFSVNQLGMLHVGGHGERLCQCKSAYIKTTKTFPVQIDGEPCKLNPSSIKLEFFNQASMLYKSKRRSSVLSEPQPSHDQVKIRVNAVKHDDFDKYNGKKEALSAASSPMLVTVVMNHSTLDTVRSCLSLIHETDRSFDTDGWVFLDASSADKFYKIDKNQENVLMACDVITSDREVYIMESADSSPAQSNFHLFPRSKLIDRQSDKFRKRVFSDSSVVHSPSKTNNLEANITGKYDSDVVDVFSSSDVIGEMGESDPSSSALDIVFEQPEIAESSPENDHVTVALVSQLNEHPTQLNDLLKIDSKQTPVSSSNSTSPAIRSGETRYESDCSSYSTSSNEYIIADDVLLATTSRQHKSPLRPTHSNPVSDSKFLSKSHPSIDQNNTKCHKRSSTDTDPKLSSPSDNFNELFDSTSLNDNQSNNNKSHSNTENACEEGRPSWNKIFLDSSKRGDLDKLMTSCKNGADLLMRDGEGYSALHHAARFSHDAIVDYLLEQGEPKLVDLTCRDRKQTALHKAAWYGRTGICKKLVYAGASINALDYMGKDALGRARQADVTSLIDFLTSVQRTKVKEMMKECHETDL